MSGTPVFVLVESASRRTVVALSPERCDDGWAVLRMLDDRHPGAKEPERDARWNEMQARMRAKKPRNTEAT